MFRKADSAHICACGTKTWVLERSGIDKGEKVTDLRRERKRMKTVAAKYEKAIESQKTNPRPVSAVAAEYGFHPEVFRDYLHKHAGTGPTAGNDEGA